MIGIRRARPSDAIAIGAVHVAAWRSTYPGILPDRFLARLSVPRQAAHYDAAIRSSTTGVYRRDRLGDRRAAGQRLAHRRLRHRRPRADVARSAGGAWRKARSRRSTCWTTGATAGWAAS